MTEELNVVGVIEDTTIKTGETGGKPWKRASIKVGGKMLASFDANVVKDILDGILREGVAVEINYKTDGMYNNIISIFPKELSDKELNKESDKGFSTADKHSSNKEVDWDSKERRTVRQNSGRHASAYIQVLTNLGLFKGYTEEQIKDAFFGFAKDFEYWVYRKDKEPKETPM